MHNGHFAFEFPQPPSTSTRRQHCQETPARFSRTANYGLEPKLWPNYSLTETTGKLPADAAISNWCIKSQVASAINRLAQTDEILTAQQSIFAWSHRRQKALALSRNWCHVKQALIATGPSANRLVSVFAISDGSPLAKAVFPLVACRYIRHPKPAIRVDFPSPSRSFQYPKSDGTFRSKTDGLNPNGRPRFDGDVCA